MAIWNDSKDTTAAAGTTARSQPPADPNPRGSERQLDAPAGDAARRAAPRTSAQDSLLAAELVIEGKIQGGGSVRLAGRFKGDIQVSGSVHIEAGAHVEGSIQAAAVVVAGELTGNVTKAKQVDVAQTGVVIGDLKADTLTVAAGARIRGNVEFGWNENEAARTVSSLKAGT